jgi:hypothetical protein
MSARNPPHSYPNERSLKPPVELARAIDQPRGLEPLVQEAIDRDLDGLGLDELARYLLRALATPSVAQTP